MDDMGNKSMWLIVYLQLGINGGSSGSSSCSS